eukprot:777940_1
MSRMQQRGDQVKAVKAMDMEELMKRFHHLPTNKQKELLASQILLFEEMDYTNSAEQDAEDLQAIEMLYNVLFDVFGIGKNHTLLEQQQLFSERCYSRIMYLFSENRHLYHEISANVSQLHLLFGRGAFTIVFPNAASVKEMQPDISTNFKRQQFLFVNKLQIIGEGQFVWYPLDLLQRIWPANSDMDKERRMTYDLELSFYLVIIMYVDYPNNMNMIMQEMSCTNDSINPDYFNKLTKFVTQDTKHKISKLKRIVHKQHRKSYEMNHRVIANQLNEIRSKFRNDTATEYTIFEFVSKMLNEILPQAGIIKFLREFDLDEFQISKITSNLIYFYTDDFKQTLVEQLTSISEAYFEEKNTNKQYHQYQDKQKLKEAFVWMVICKILYALGSNEELQPMITIFTSIEFIEWRQKHQMQDDGIKYAQEEFEWTSFTNRLIGRQCANCNKQEARDKSKKERFSKCASCRYVFYCSSKCQKYHWKKQHRKDCKNIRQYMESLQLI